MEKNFQMLYIPLRGIFTSRRIDPFAPIRSYLTSVLHNALIFPVFLFKKTIALSIYLCYTVSTQPRRQVLGAGLDLLRDTITPSVPARTARSSIIILFVRSFDWTSNRDFNICKPYISARLLERGASGFFAGITLCRIRIRREYIVCIRLLFTSACPHAVFLFARSTSAGRAHE